MPRNYQRWQKKTAKIGKGSTKSSRSTPKVKTLEEMSKEELIKIVKKLRSTIKDLEVIIKKLKIQLAQLQGIQITTQGSKIIPRGKVSAEPRLPIH